MTKKSRQKSKYLENEKSFWGEIKSIFIIFKGLSVAKNCFRPKSAPLNYPKSITPIIQHFKLQTYLLGSKNRDIYSRVLTRKLSMSQFLWTLIFEDLFVNSLKGYHEKPKISPWTYVFQGSFKVPMGSYSGRERGRILYLGKKQI